MSFVRSVKTQNLLFHSSPHRSPQGCSRDVVEAAEWFPRNHSSYNSSIFPTPCHAPNILIPAPEYTPCILRKSCTYCIDHLTLCPLPPPLKHKMLEVLGVSPVTFLSLWKLSLPTFVLQHTGSRDTKRSWVNKCRLETPLECLKNRTHDSPAKADPHACIFHFSQL